MLTQNPKRGELTKNLKYQKQYVVYKKLILINPDIITSPESHKHESKNMALIKSENK